MTERNRYVPREEGRGLRPPFLTRNIGRSFSTHPIFQKITKEEMTEMLKRGNIYLADCGCDSGGSQQHGIRPVIVVSNDKANTHSPAVTVVPLTARIWKKRDLPTHVLIPRDKCCGLPRTSMALAEQVTTIGKDQLIERWGHITDQRLMEKVTAALQVQIGAAGSNR